MQSWMPETTHHPLIEVNVESIIESHILASTESDRAERASRANKVIPLAASKPCSPSPKFPRADVGPSSWHRKVNSERQRVAAGRGITRSHPRRPSRKVWLPSFTFLTRCTHKKTDHFFFFGRGSKQDFAGATKFASHRLFAKIAISEGDCCWS